MYMQRIHTIDQHFEIVSLVGTLSHTGEHHLHMSLSDAEGHVIGGHVMGDLIGNNGYISFVHMFTPVRY